MNNKIMIEENIFPRWEHNIPTLGTKHSHAGNKTTLRLTVTLLLMMVVGVSELRSQTAAPVGYDFSGVYYIANHNRKGTSGYDGYNSSDITKNFYLRPSSDTYDVDGEQPFLTTKKDRTSETPNPDIAKWTIIFAKTEGSTDYYYLKHNSNRYLTWHDPMSISGANATDRVRLHLQSTLNEEKALFYFTKGNKEDNDYNICLKGVNCSKNTPGSLNPAKDNKDNEAGVSISGAGTVTVGSKTIQCGGLIGIYEQNDATGVWYLEDYIQRPAISYSGSSGIEITNNVTGATVYYTTDGTDPITSVTRKTGTDETTLASFTDGDIIKAVAKVGDEYSNVATFRAVVHVGSSNKYLIQNLERTDFYMIPGDVDKNSNTTVNTNSLPQAGMSWYFEYAGNVDGVQYYYFINGSTGDYLYFTSNNVYMKISSAFAAATDKTGYMFTTVQGYDDENNPDGFHIVPKAQISDNTYCIYKGGWSSTTTIANASADAMKGSTNARRPEQKYTRWNFVKPNTLNKTAPFTVTDASTHITKFYKIASVGDNAYYIVPPTGSNTNATASNSTDAAVLKSGTWYFEEAQAATASDWCTYYYIRNAETGKYLYFTKDGTNYTSTPKACLEMRETKTGDEDPYLFTWARTAEENVNYYLVPKKLKDVSLNKIGTLQRNTNTLQSDLRRDAGNYAWTFEDAALFCSNPIFEESGENIVISCQNIEEIHYTTNGDDPSADGVSYSVYPPTTPFSKSDQHLIKACTVVSDGTNSASSDVVTLFNKPDITLSQESYTYDGSEKKPSITKVAIGETVVPSSEYTSEGVSPTYTNNTNAGTGTVKPTVTLTDVADNNLIIANASRTFEILPLVVTLDWGNTDLPYSGSEQAPTPEITNLIGEDVCTITVSVEGEHINAGDYTATAVSLSNTNYQLPTDATLLTKAFRIIPKPLGDGVTPSTGITVNITKSGDDFIITVKHGENLLNSTDHYDVTGPVEEDGIKTWTITGKGNYSNSVQVMYKLLTFWKTGETTDGMQEVAPFISEHTDMESPSGMTPYIVSGINMAKHVLKLKSVSYIPKDEPVLLLSATLSSNDETETDFTASPKNVTTPDDTSMNILKVSTGQTVDAGEVYAFHKGKFILTSSGTLKVGKFYMDNPNYQALTSDDPSGAPLRIVFDDTTTIDDIQTYNNIGKEEVWHSIDGRRLNSKPTNKGLYIHNGRKVVIK